MTSGRPAPALARGLLALAALLAATGCRAPHRVRVDAISHPHEAPGPAYVLELNESGPGADPLIRAQALAEVRSALAARGLYETPAGAPPDLLVQCEYGVGPGHMILEYKPRDMLTIDYWGKLPPHGGATAVLVYDKYLKLTARTPLPAEDAAAPRRAVPPGEELWSVHLTIEDRRKELSPYLPILASASVDYIAANPGAEVVVKLPRRPEATATAP